ILPSPAHTLYDAVSNRTPHSFPTRRSSDLARGVVRVGLGKLTREIEIALVDGQRLRTAAHGDVLVADALERYRQIAFPFVIARIDRKSTRLNSSHVKISYAVFCLKKKISNR